MPTRLLPIFVFVLFLFSCQNDLQEAERTTLDPTAYNEATAAEKRAAMTDEEIPRPAAPNPYNAVSEATDDDAESIDNPEISDDCADAVMDIVDSSPRVKAMKKEIEAEGQKPSILLGDTPETSDDGRYDFRIGINGDLRFETVGTVYFMPKTGKLYENDWLTGEDKEIAYDGILLKALGEDCY